jgi:hypothetical protein
MINENEGVVIKIDGTTVIQISKLYYQALLDGNLIIDWNVIFKNYQNAKVKNILKD